MPTKQKQKQKQTVIVNIGDKLLAKKRKRKPRKKKAPAPGGAYMPPPGPPPPPMDFARVLYPPQPPLRADDNLAVQLNSVTKQLQDLQDKQQHRTANLMAGARAIAREEGAQGSVLEEVSQAPAPAPPTPAKRRSKQEVLESQAMGFEDKTKRPYAKKQTRAEEAAALLLQQSGVMGGGHHNSPSLADFERGSAMSSITMTPELRTPAPEPAKKRLVIREPMPTPTPDTSSLSGASSFGEASAATEPRF